jgi:hypothetical protein
MIEILGYITAAVIVFIAAKVVYETLKGLVVGVDLVRWKLEGVSWAKICAVKNYKRELAMMVFRCWGECIGYNGGISYSRNGRTWEGYGTGRYNG